MSQKGANEGDLDNVSVSYEVSSTTESMSQKGANQLGHLASVLRGRAVDVVHLSRLVWLGGMVLTANQVTLRLVQMSVREAFAKAAYRIPPRKRV